MRTIKLMADYQCFPLWEASPGGVGNIDPQDLPISLSLKQTLMMWAAKFDATLNMDDPVNSGFESEQSASEFRQEGNTLAQRLQEELGAAYVVIKKYRSLASVARASPFGNVTVGILDKNGKFFPDPLGSSKLLGAP